MHPAIVIAGVHHPESYSGSKFLELVPSESSPTGDMLNIEYNLSPEETRTNKKREARLKSALRKLGCFPLKTIETPMGGSIHYSGTLPFDQTGKPFTLNSNGKLSGTKNVFVADGSGFAFLPAKGLTLSLMANAHLVAEHIVKNES
jgi:choline dehydrogenase-like flavoprotein